MDQEGRLRRAEDRAQGLERSRLASEDDNKTYMKERLDN